MTGEMVRMMQQLIVGVDRWMLEVALRAWIRIAGHGRDRGDVPGWVLVTIMTAGLVTALWLVADERLKALFSDALDSVVGNAP